MPHLTGLSLNHQAINKTASIEQPVYDNDQNVQSESSLPEHDDALEIDYQMFARMLLDFHYETHELNEEKPPMKEAA